jgi:hypothetical protein
MMMQVPGQGAFVRALLPVHLTGGHSFRFGVWVSISPADLQHASSVWWEDDYVGLAFEGVLANGIGPWNLLGGSVRLKVLDKDQLPYCVSSSDDALHDLLTLTWPRDEFFAVLCSPTA